MKLSPPHPSRSPPFRHATIERTRAGRGAGGELMLVQVGEHVPSVARNVPSLTAGLAQSKRDIEAPPPGDRDARRPSADAPPPPPGDRSPAGAAPLLRAVRLAPDIVLAAAAAAPP